MRALACTNYLDGLLSDFGVLVLQVDAEGLDDRGAVVADVLAQLVGKLDDELRGGLLDVRELVEERLRDGERRFLEQREVLLRVDLEEMAEEVDYREADVLARLREGDLVEAREQQLQDIDHDVAVERALVALRLLAHLLQDFDADLAVLLDRVLEDARHVLAHVVLENVEDDLRVRLLREEPLLQVHEPALSDVPVLEVEEVNKG